MRKESKHGREPGRSKVKLFSQVILCEQSSSQLQLKMCQLQYELTGQLVAVLHLGEEQRRASSLYKILVLFFIALNKNQFQYCNIRDDDPENQPIFRLVCFILYTFVYRRAAFSSIFFKSKEFCFTNPNSVAQKFYPNMFKILQ